jgi:peptidoglycan/xylan/chitin deacetylase (PgdA/CDA1 family)
MELRKWLRRFKRRFEHKAIVLMYHRIARLKTDPWQLAVDPVNFEQQLQVLKKDFYVIPINELMQQLQQGYIGRNCVCITFDDGYSDNFFNAKPLLEKYRCPAVFFIASQFTDRKQLFWWDELQQILLDAYALPRVFSLVIQGEKLIYNLEDDVVLSMKKRQQQRLWVAPDDPPNRRCELYIQVWERLRPLPHVDLQHALDRVRLWAGGLNGTDHLNLPLTSSQLYELANQPLFDIGLHTTTHTSLPFHPKNVQRLEIHNNQNALSQLCPRSCKILTYPYGDYNNTTIEVVKEEHLTAAFTTRAQAITPRSDFYSLGRFHVKNWNRPDFEKQLSNWIKT